MKAETRKRTARPTLTPEEIAELRQWLTSRKEAAKQIDIEICEIGWWYVNVLDEYGILEQLGELSPECQIGGEWCNIGRETFVWSPDSDGPILVSDLPPEKEKQLRDRIRREQALAEGRKKLH
jgi:hypothetical protein